jgi:proline iminopeptidase
MSSFASYDGTRLAYTEAGTGPRLVCLPGGPGRASVYLEDLGGLSESRTLVRLDTRATGHSEVPPDPSTLRFDRLADDVEALRAHLGEESLDLLGHSAGCLVAQAYAAAHPGRVRSLVLVTPSDRLQGGSRDDVEQIRAGRSAEPWYPDAAEAAAALATAPPAQQQALVRATRPFFYGRWDGRTQAHAAGADRQSSKRAELGFGAGIEGVDVAGILARLRGLDVPVLVVGGEHDALTGVRSVGLVAETFPRAEQVVLPGAGHFPWVDEPAAFRAVVDDFLGTMTA